MNLFALAALLLIAIPGRSVAAQRPVERTVQGVVESVDTKSQLMTLKLAHPTSSNTTMTVGWRSRTAFEAANGDRTKAESLKPGMTIEVRYRSLIAGANQASRITLK